MWPSSWRRPRSTGPNTRSGAASTRGMPPWAQRSPRGGSWAVVHWQPSALSEPVAPSSPLVPTEASLLERSWSTSRRLVLCQCIATPHKRTLRIPPPPQRRRKALLPPRPLPRRPRSRRQPPCKWNCMDCSSGCRDAWRRAWPTPIPFEATSNDTLRMHALAWFLASHRSSACWTQSGRKPRRRRNTTGS